MIVEEGNSKKYITKERDRREVRKRRRKNKL
jgi:hypothetical protein